MFAEEELQAAAGMGAESILRIIEPTRALDRRVIPTASAEQERGQPRGAERINERGDLHRIGVDTGVADVISAVIDRPFEGKVAGRVQSDLSSPEPPA